MTSRHRLCRLALAAAAVLLSGCIESAFRDDADQQVYRLQRQRQQETLGNESDTRIGFGEIPTQDAPESYRSVPPTANDIESAARAALIEGATMQPAEALTQPAPLPTTLPTGAALQQLLSGDAENQQEMLPLPEFPRPVAAGKTRRSFTLDDCFNFGLGHSRDYVSRKEDLYIAALNVTLQRHMFEPRMFATTGVNVAGTGEYSDRSAALSATQTVGVSQKLPYGGEVVASAVASSVNQLRGVVTESESASVVLAANVPLLRGAGNVAREDLIQTERELVYEVREFERYRRAFLVNVASQYFSLVNQRAQIMNRYRNVQSYTFITNRTKALFDAGRPRIGLLDYQRARQSELQARSDLISAIESYELSVDNFKLLLGMSTEEAIDIAPQYLSIAPPATTDAAAVAVADRLRLDLQTVRDRVEDSRRQVKLAGNNLLPDLNANAQASLGTDPARKTIAVEGDRLDYQAGLTLSLPLDRVAERNSYRVSLINLDRAKRNVDQATDQVALDVRTAVRRVRQQQFLVALQRSNIALAQRRKAFADIQFRDGKIDNRDYLDAETALLSAQNSFAQALSGLQIATLQYLRDTDQLRVDAHGKLLAPTSALGMKTPAATRPQAAPATGPAAAPSTMPQGTPDAVVPE